MVVMARDPPRNQTWSLLISPVLFAANADLRASRRSLLPLQSCSNPPYKQHSRAQWRTGRVESNQALISKTDSIILAKAALPPLFHFGEQTRTHKKTSIIFVQSDTPSLTLGAKPVHTGPIVGGQREPTAPSAERKLQPSVSLGDLKRSTPMDHSPSQSRFAEPAGMDRNDYVLNIIQQPQVARVAVGKEKDRKPIDPPPIAQLIIRSDHYHKKYLQNPYLFMTSTLVPAEENAPSLPASALVGTLVSSIHRLKDKSNNDGAYFVWGDLSSKHEGNFLLEFHLFELLDMECHYVKSVRSEAFPVYSSREYCGMNASTELTRTFSEQGVRLRIHKEPKKLLRKRGPASDDYQPQKYNKIQDRKRSQGEIPRGEGNIQSPENARLRERTESTQSNQVPPHPQRTPIDRRYSQQSMMSYSSFEEPSMHSRSSESSYHEGLVSQQPLVSPDYSERVYPDQPSPYSPMYSPPQAPQQSYGYYAQSPQQSHPPTRDQYPGHTQPSPNPHTGNDSQFNPNVHQFAFRGSSVDYQPLMNAQYNAAPHLEVQVPLSMRSTMAPPPPRRINTNALSSARRIIPLLREFVSGAAVGLVRSLMKHLLRSRVEAAERVPGLGTAYLGDRSVTYLDVESTCIPLSKHLPPPPIPHPIHQPQIPLDMLARRPSYSIPALTQYLTHISLPPPQRTILLQNMARPGWSSSNEALAALHRLHGYQQAKIPFANLYLHYSAHHVGTLDAGRLYEYIIQSSGIAREGEGEGEKGILTVGEGEGEGEEGGEDGRGGGKGGEMARERSERWERWHLYFE
ncbi:hypothetical protein B7494_g3649 [Chlorociboria aeruginascens]|nr:hypothetical protein B7494_g3649 [Chlorociboria aeruginascens]